MKTIKPITKEATCSFQFWDRNKRMLTPCGDPALFQYGKECLCQEHAEYICGVETKCNKVNSEGKTVLKLSDVLKGCKNTV